MIAEQIANLCYKFQIGDCKSEIPPLVVFFAGFRAPPEAIRQLHGEKIRVVIEDFISPTIIERLSQQAGLLQPRIDDWRSMVDCVMIDANYNGEVFNVCLSDVPEKKTDLVSGAYELPVPKGKTRVALKIIDMLGEEVLEVREV